MEVRKNAFEKFRDKEFPKENQEIFALNEGFIMIRKSDITLDWYKRIREQLESEGC